MAYDEPNLYHQDNIIEIPESVRDSIHNFLPNKTFVHENANLMHNDISVTQNQAEMIQGGALNYNNMIQMFASNRFLDDSMEQKSQAINPIQLDNRVRRNNDEYGNMKQYSLRIADVDNELNTGTQQA